MSTRSRERECFNGGCGSRRPEIAVAQLGATKHLGGARLEVLQSEVESRGLANIKIVLQDLTDLSDWDSNSFDSVASIRVLHQTDKCDHATCETFRMGLVHG